MFRLVPLLFFFLLTTLVLFSSCEKDTIEVEPKYNHFNGASIYDSTFCYVEGIARNGETGEPLAGYYLRRSGEGYCNSVCEAPFQLLGEDGSFLISTCSWSNVWDVCMLQGLDVHLATADNPDVEIASLWIKRDLLLPGNTLQLDLDFEVP